MSKNINLANNWSKKTVRSEFITKPGNIIVGNNQPYGSPNIESVQNGVDYPNAQAAIDDMAALFILPVNTVIITNDGISPGGASQQDEFKFVGNVTDSALDPGTDVVFNFLGFDVIVKVGDSPEEVAAKVKLVLDVAVSDRFVINRVNAGATLDILQITYNDYQRHVIKPYISQGVSVTQSILSPARSGYGIWSRLGTQTITLDGAVGSTVLTYFKRDA